MEFEDAVIEATGDAEVRHFIKEWYDDDEIRDCLSDALRSKIHRDGISRELELTIEGTSDIPDLDNPPELPESSGEDPITVRRYLDTSKFASFLNSGIWFSRLDNFSDNYEGKVSDKTVRRRYDQWEYLEFEDDPPPFDTRDMDAAIDEIIRKQSYVSCWRYGGKESAVFWNAYIDGGNGVAVETTLDRLQNIIREADRDILLGKVDYRRYKGSTEQFARDSIDRVFHKRFAFDDEQELRLLARQQVNDIAVNKGQGRSFDIEINADNGFRVNVNADELIEKVILPPNVKDREISRVVQLMEYHEIDAEVWRSILDVSPGTTAPQKVTGENAGEITRDDMKHVRVVDKSIYKK